MKEVIWDVVTSDGNRFDSTKDNWHEVNDNYTIQYMTLILPTETIHLPPRADKYYQSKTASCHMNGDNVQVESHNYEATYEDKKLIIKVQEDSNDIYIGLEDLS